MNTRQRRKRLKMRSMDSDVMIRLEAKSDMILERFDRMERHSAVVGAVAGGIAGGVAGTVMAAVVVYAKSLFEVR